MSDTSRLSPATIAAQAAGAIDVQTGGVVPALPMATTYLRDAAYQPLRPDNIYLRDQSDIVRVAENVLAQLEGAKETLLFPSGMAALAAAFRTVPNGGRVLVQSQIYWGTTKWIRDFCTRRDIEVREVEASDTVAFTQTCASFKPTLALIETPSNPWLRVVDIQAAADGVHAVGGLLVVDSTAATPVLQQPLRHGADIVMHSATKGINGHSDVLAGVLATNNVTGRVWEDIKIDRHDAGAVIGPFEAWLLVRGMRTLPLRVREMSSNAAKLAAFLQDHPKIETVLYPGLPSHNGYELAQTQMTGGFGSLLSCVVKGGAEAALTVISKLTVFHRATSLGGVESLVEHRHTIEPHTGIPEGLLRLSVGIESIDDLRNDLVQAFDT
ncbi:MAG: PLP-dependent transferase [Sulfitobacter litoralis]|jgi:cystathionine gamma-synthase|uniref:Cystathionine gamma-synthase n=2 Tax=root TaxID=1 RepID=A0A1H0M4T2_9RHOB|nr:MULTISPECIES: PLP-dependent transferase [Sulfitobacter]MBQ0717633.1 PLP-dependent transferase [Sulfitobacter litoralis]MBQ0767266.1 PLP-dependent transferase [Sulfitobacter litoralis]MBQ0802961.1 PLP-dependent transferase [Sulfitobacter litoralis]MCF7725394.1 cystathionine gamma-synthase [Sulfitobacter sp. M22]MCF7776781.1 cystathionine gamma-synthase [Sulfitobacter sp. M220]|tara:strand:+ start:1762 stop:2910 length:1149 start_codon:yes stop_codon:yes gene_type:complete